MKSNPFKSKKYNIYNQSGSKRKNKRNNRISGFFGGGINTDPFKASDQGEGKKSKIPFIGDKDLYIDTYRTKGRPAWIIPVVLTVMILLLVFWTGPMILNAVMSRFVQKDGDDKASDLLYKSSDYAVVSKQTIDVFLTPDIKSTRVTQLLYNDIIKITDRKTYGFLNITSANGAKGYIIAQNVTTYTDSVEPSLYSNKIIVVTKSKRVMSHSSNGSLVMEVLMGTTLYSDFQSSNVYRVVLPDKTYGWISASGIVKLKVDESIKKSSAKNFYETAISFNNTTYVEAGITANGASSDGIAFVCAMVNGVTLPRDKASQSKTGVAVPVQFDAQTKMPNYELLQQGDLIFFGDGTSNDGKITEMGIVVGDGQVMMSRKSKSTVRIVSLDMDAALGKSIVAVRRLY